MKDIYLVNYSVRGIKSLDRLISLSFYKKTISKNPDTQNYNIKGIYGMNGSGKSGIVTSVEILRNLLINPVYLNNPVVQKNLDAMINKKLGELYIEADFLAKGKSLLYYRYNVTLSKDLAGKYIVSSENLYVKKATSKSEAMENIYAVLMGEIKHLYGLQKQDKLSTLLQDKTTNLLTTASMCALFYEKILLGNMEDSNDYNVFLFASLSILFLAGRKLHVYMDESDVHRGYVTRRSLDKEVFGGKDKNEVNTWIDHYLALDNDYLDVIFIAENYIQKTEYFGFVQSVHKLYEFLHIFKPDLKNIEIDRKEDHDIWICDLIMVYDTYKIHAEFESTGIKKLITLYAYLKEMMHGGIVFIDEFDSNLHDVYLCALLEYLMEYAEGQLCFTTHNVGPMDVLKQHKKSIEFLSENHQIYSWATNGNYSPSKLYRRGMIEGSPFNVDSIDFIGVFGSAEEEE